MKLRNPIIAGTLALSVAACGSEDTDTTNTETGGEAAVGQKVDSKEDAWNYRNDPAGLARFANVSLKRKFDELPKAGEAARKPWPDTYWATYLDSTNHRWQGKDKLSPLEKYDLAYNGWEMPAGFMDLRPYDPNNCEDGFDAEYYTSLGPAARFMSENKGNKAARNLVYRNGSETPVCDEKTREAVETWWGLCHAWAPAAITEPEPIHPVTVNGVTFYSADIKALIQTVYDSSKSMILGGRCNTKDVERDEFGRIKDDDCRDTNAGAFHLIMTNFLGIHGMSLLEDRTYNYEVWNQPVEGFEVTQSTEVELARALELLGRAGETKYPYNDKAKYFIEVFATVRYVTESHAEAEALLPVLSRYIRKDNYHYLLELDANREVIGGEWLQGRGQHPRWGISEQPDFLWFSTGPQVGGYTRANPYVSYEKVKELINKSRQAPTPTGGGTEESRQVFASEQVVAIPDNDPAGAESTVTIGETLTAKSVQVQLDIEHTYIGDLEVRLLGPDIEIILRDREGGSADNIDALIEVPDLAGKQMGGEYVLHVIDHARLDAGKIIRWALLVDAQ